MVTVTNLYRKGFQVLKNDGTENSSGKIYFYDAGTSNPQTVYSDAAGTASLGTNVTLDSDGRTQTAIYISTTDVKVEHQDSDSNVIFPAEDNIPGAEESASIGYSKPETPTNVKNSTGTIDASDASEVFLCDTTSGSITLTLQNSSAYADGHPLAFVKTDSSSNTVTIASSDSETLDAHGATSLVLRQQGDALKFMPDGANFHIVSTAERNNRLPRLYRSGCVLSNDTDADHDINIADGVVRDIDDTYDIALISEITKQIDAVWASGDDAGGLDTGTVTTDTTYHVFLIANPTSGAVDVLFSTSLASPTMPTGYTKKRRVGSVLTDGSSNILPFVQHDDLFYWDSPQYSIYSSTGTATTRTHALGVPTGIRLECALNIFVDNASQIYIFPADITAATPSQTASPLITAEDGGGAYGRQIQALTDTSGQIKFQTNTDTDARFAVVSFKDAFIT